MEAPRDIYIYIYISAEVISNLNVKDYCLKILQPVLINKKNINTETSCASLK